MPNHKPAGFPAVSPSLISYDARASIRFMQDVLGAEIISEQFTEEGRLIHASIRLDDSVIMIGEATPDWPAHLSHIHVYVPDVDESYQKALASGAASVLKPVQRGDADKRGGVKDAGGTTWWLATHQG